MRKNKAAFLLMVALLVIIAGGCGMAAPSAGTVEGSKGDGPIIIGHIAALSGDNAAWGQSEKKALEMMVNNINADGGVLGRELKLISYDNGGDQTGAFTAANRLANDGALAVIGPSQSNLSITAAQVFEEAGIVMISTTGTNDQLTVPAGHSQPLRYIFRTNFTDADQAEKAALFAVEYLDVRKAGILKDSSSDYSLNLTAYFEQAFAEKGGVITANESFQAGDPELTGQLSRIKESGAQLLFIPTFPTEGKLVIKQAKELAMDYFFLGGDAWAGQQLQGMDSEIMEGSFFVNISKNEDSAIAHWIDSYSKYWEEEPMMPDGALAADALHLIIEGIKETEGTDPGRLADWIAGSRDIQVLTGVITMNPDTHSPLNRQTVIETIAQGKYTALY